MNSWSKTIRTSDMEPGKSNVPTAVLSLLDQYYSQDARDRNFFIAEASNGEFRTTAPSKIYPGMLVWLLIRDNYRVWYIGGITGGIEE